MSKDNQKSNIFFDIYQSSIDQEPIKTSKSKYILTSIFRLVLIILLSGFLPFIGIIVAFYLFHTSKRRYEFVVAGLLTIFSMSLFWLVVNFVRQIIETLINGGV